MFKKTELVRTESKNIVKKLFTIFQVENIISKRNSVCIMTLDRQSHESRLIKKLLENFKKYVSWS